MGIDSDDRKQLLKEALLYEGVSMACLQQTLEMGEQEIFARLDGNEAFEHIQRISQVLGIDAGYFSGTMRYVNGKLVKQAALRKDRSNYTPMLHLTELFSNDLVLVEASQEHQLIQVSWLQHTCGAPLRGALERALEQAKATGLRRWLYDMRQISYTTVADQSWTTREFFPAFDPQLHHRLACVATWGNVEMLPETLIQDALRNDPLLKERLEMNMFLDLELAKDWLLL